MKLITHELIRSLNIKPAICVEWISESFSLKSEAMLPPKISLHPTDVNFFNFMPCRLPERFGRISVKIVRRIVSATPTLTSDILLYDEHDGKLLAMLDGDWITSMRTGAVATIAAKTFRRSGNISYGFIGLGNTARATLLCLLDSEPEENHEVKILRYKKQAEDFITRFSAFSNVHFTIEDTPENIVRKSDVIFSCLTNANDLICPYNNAFRPGCLLLPIHTKGFQNCDLFFDKVFADDRAHICNFRYFDRFKEFAEISDVLSGKTAGRTNDTQRILSYNIGLGLHDALFASKIYDLLSPRAKEICIPHAEEKFYI